MKNSYEKCWPLCRMRAAKIIKQAAPNHTNTESSINKLVRSLVRSLEQCEEKVKSLEPAAPAALPAALPAVSDTLSAILPESWSHSSVLAAVAVGFGCCP